VTPEDKSSAKIAGAMLAIAFLSLLVLCFGPRAIDAFRALDDGPAHKPSEWRR
jgi:hypothetical protein